MNPFTQKRTISYRVFEMAEKGTTLKEIENYVIKKGSNAAGAARLIRILRKGQYHGCRWNISESAGTIQVKEEKKRGKGK